MTAEEYPAPRPKERLLPLPWLCLMGVAMFIVGWAIGSGMGLPEPFAHLDGALLRDLLVYDEANPLLFNSGLFLLLFAGFTGVYALCRRHRTLRIALVVAFSLYFYWKSSAGYCLILLCVCVSDYLSGRLMERTESRAGRRAIVWANVAMNVGMLVYFKYFNLLYLSVASLFGPNPEPLDILLPAGISFFSFRSISYIVDLYRRKLDPCTSFGDYLFFLTFFPPLLAGPVVRAADLLPQIRRNRGADRAMVSEGLFLVMCGLVKKVIVADYLAGNFVDRIFENPALYSGFENLMGVAGFTIQIYCDFSGYSDMAIGVALMLGFRFKENFSAPFKAQNPGDFWRRWHISLSSWLKDYIYIPLGGNRKGKVRQYINITATMLIGGLWHGASWMHLLWGGYNGILLAGHKAVGKHWRAPERLRGTRLLRALNIALTLTLIMVGMMIFKAHSLGDIGVICRQILTDFRPGVIPSFMEAYMLITGIIAGAWVMHFLPGRHTVALRGFYTTRPFWQQAIILAAILFIIIQSRQSDLVPFVYLQY